MIEILSVKGAEIFILSFILMIILFFSLRFERNMERNQRTYLRTAIVCHLIALATIIHALPLESAMYVRELKLLYSFTYTANELTCLFFTLFLISMLRERTFISYTPEYIVAFASFFTAFLLVFSLYNTGFICYVDQNGSYVTGPLFLISLLTPALIMIFDASLTISCRQHLTKRELISMLSFYLFPFIAIIYTIVTEEDYSAPATTLGFYCIFINVCLESTRKISLQKVEMAESRMKLMISQIQPHFMYNSLNSIYYLIGKDKDKAKNALRTFGDYLINNLDKLQTDRPVPIEEEMNHVKAYLYLEQLRFDEDLEIIYDIRSVNFLIPPLTVQPLVENAVKHGIAPKRGGGTVLISTMEVGHHFEIIVSDNGVGFEYDNPVDSGNMELTEQSSHVGIENVRSRIEDICDGTVEIDSKEGFGTTIKIIIPSKWKKGEDNENNVC